MLQSTFFQNVLANELDDLLQSTPSRSALRQLTCIFARIATQHTWVQAWDRAVHVYSEAARVIKFSDEASDFVRETWCFGG